MKYMTYKSQTVRNICWLALGLVLIALVSGCWHRMSFVLKMISGVGVVICIILAALAVAGMASKRSISAIILFYVFRMIPIKDRRNPEIFRNYMESNSKAYVLNPKTVRKYNITKFLSTDDTYVIDHQDSSEDLVVFYIHGGGYWVRPYGIHFTMFDKLARRLHAKFIIPVYPLAPAHNAVDANNMVMERYLQMINEEHADPEKVIFMGDSAGAGLSMSLMLQLKEKKLPLPREAVYFSPWVDASNSTLGMEEIRDPFLNIPNLTYGGEIYADDLEGGAKNPMVSPIYGDMRGLPKMTAFGGTYDSLNLDAMKMADKAKTEGFDYTIYVYPKMIHGYAGFFFTPEAKYAIRQVENVVNGRPVENIIT